MCEIVYNTDTYDLVSTPVLFIQIKSSIVRQIVKQAGE